MSGECKVTFSTNIRNYFGFSDHKDFWKRVIFFNYMPCGVGEASARYNVGSSEMRTRAKRRFISILGEVKPNKVLVFTHKGWMDCPDTPCEPLGNAFPPDFTWGKYAIGEHVTAAYGLRHPQGANGDTMKRAVRHILDMPVL